MQGIRDTIRQGFTLVELAIVLVIIGLLVGGVLVGADMIRTAEMRSLISDLEKIKAGVATFQGKYNQLPGDFSEATTYWGVDATCSAGNRYPPTGGPALIATCNGSGDGIVNSCPSCLDNSVELFLFWHHLSKAGLINGNYSGVSVSPGNGHAEPGWNVPLTNYNNVGISVTYNVTATPSGNTSAWVAAGAVGHVMTLGTDRPSQAPTYPAFSGEQAYQLDAKIDDGRPAYGVLYIGMRNNALNAISTCYHNSGDAPGVTSVVDNTQPELAIYDSSVTKIDCHFLMRNPF